MIFELETAVKIKLQTITRFKEVYDFYVTTPSGYPYAAFELSDFAGEFLDSCTNKREITFGLIVVQEIKQTTRDAGKDIIYKCLEDIITAFDGDQDLGQGTIVKGNVTKGEMGTILGKEGQILALNVEIKLEITTTANP